MNKPVAFVVIAICLALASFIVLAATRESPIFSEVGALPASGGSAGEACQSATAFVAARLFEDYFRDVSLGGCETLVIRRQDGGGWLVAGETGATQFRSPVTVHWLVSTDSAGRICKYGSGTRGYRPKLLEVARCG
jgi:hypothetical protein